MKVTRNAGKLGSARLVDRAQLAEFIGLTDRRVHQLVREGMPRRARGNYDLDKAVRWYVRYLQAAIERRAIPMEGDALVSEQRERVRKMRIDADLKETQLARERAQLVAISDVEKELAELVLETKARILSVAPRLAPELLGETSRVMAQAKIEKALREALTQLARRAL